MCLLSDVKTYPAACGLAVLTALLAGFAGAAGAGEEGSAGHAGVGDGHIQVISSLEPHSIKDGERLTVSAVVSSERPVASVEADLGGLATVTLEPDADRGGTAADRTAGIWTAEWAGDGREEKVHPVTLTVTDESGHSFTGEALSVGDNTAGLSEPGTTEYPDGGMRRVDREVFINEVGLETAVIDPENEYAYFGTNTSPGQVIKVALGSGSNPPERVAALRLEDGENLLTSSVIDAENGYAYFGTNTSPAYVVKVALGEGDEPPRRVASAQLYTPLRKGGPSIPMSDAYLRTAVIDPDNGYAYFGTDTSPGRVVRVALGEGDEPPSRDGAVTFPEGENEDYLRSSVIDTENGYAYFGTDTFPGRVVKVALGDGSSGFERLGSVPTVLPLPPTVVNFPFLRSAVIDTDAGYAYFGTGTETGVVVKVDLGEGDDLPQPIDATALEEGEGPLHSAAIDPASGLAYFGTGVDWDEEIANTRVVKVALGAGDDAPSRVAAFPGTTSGAFVRSMVLDREAGHIYLGNHSLIGGGLVTKLAVGGLNEAPFELGALVLRAVGSAAGSVGNERVIDSAGIDTVTGRVYWGTDSSPGRVVKTSVGGPEDAPTRLGAGRFSAPFTGASEQGAHTTLLDTGNGYGYFGTRNSPGFVIKMDLGGEDGAPSRLGRLQLTDDEDDLRSGVIDPENGYAYFGTNTSPGRVVKVALGEGDELPERVATLELNEGEDYLTAAVIDPENGHAYFGTNTSPARVVKVGLGSGDNPPFRLGTATLQTTVSRPNFPPLVIRESYLVSGAINPEAGLAYFGTDTEPGVVAVVDLGGGSNPPSRAGRVNLEEDEDHLRAAAIDTGAGALFFGTHTTPGRVVKFNLDEDDGMPSRTGAVELTSGEAEIGAAVVDAANGFLHVGTGVDDTPGRAVRVAMGQKGLLKGTRFEMEEDGDMQEMRLYSHAAEGIARLSLYDDSEPRQLLWESGPVAVNAEEDDLVVPVSEGTPSSLHLSEGTYWAAWQIDTNVPVPSYTEGNEGDGFLLPMSFGPEPENLSQWTSESTSERWTQFIVYDPADAIPGDFNGDGCVDFTDFNILLENWGDEYQGTMMDFSAFNDLLQNWGTGC